MSEVAYSVKPHWESATAEHTRHWTGTYSHTVWCQNCLHDVPVGPDRVTTCWKCKRMFKMEVTASYIDLAVVVALPVQGRVL